MHHHPALNAGGSGRRVIYIAGADTVVQLENISLTGANVNMNGAGVYIESRAELILLAGSAIEENRIQTSREGGGIYADNAVLLMFGGFIRNNRGPGGGENSNAGGVALNNSEFTMYNGTIQGNQAKWTGGVQLAGKSLFTMYDGIIYDNDASRWNGDYSAAGGGVAIRGSSSFIMKGGSIKANYANGNLGGSQGGGGVLVADSGSFIMSGNASIEDNTIDNNGYCRGAGVRLVSGTFDMRDNAVLRNNRRPSGGAIENVYRDSTGSTFILKGVVQTAAGAYTADPIQ